MLLPRHHAPTKHNDIEFFGVAYLVKQTGSDLLLSEETLFPQKKNRAVSNATEEESDGSDIEDNVTSDEGYVDGSMEVPATSDDPLKFDEGAACLEEEHEAEDEEEEDNEEESEEVNHIKLYTIHLITVIQML